MTTEPNTTPEYPPFPEPAIGGYEDSEGVFVQEGYSEEQMRAYVDADRASRAQAAQALEESFRKELDTLSTRNYELRMENSQLRAAQAVPYVDRSEAVNVANNIIEFGLFTNATRKTVQTLVDAVLKMDAALAAAPSAPVVPQPDFESMYIKLTEAMGYDSGKDGLEWSPEEWAARLRKQSLAQPKEAAPAAVPNGETAERQSMSAHRASFFMERFLREEKLLGPNEQAAVRFVIDMLASVTHPAEGVPVDQDLFECGKAAGRQEVKDAQSSPDFRTWINQAYREPEITQYTIHNMEVAYQAGRESATQPTGVPAQGDALADLAAALDMFVGADPLHSLCEHAGMDAFGRVKGTWSKAAEVNARAALQLHRAAIAQTKESGS